MNVITPKFIADFSEAIDRIASDAAILGVVIASGKDSGFMAGMDLKQMSTMLQPAPGEKPSMAAIFDKAFVLNALFRRLETCGKPVAAAIEGVALGGGLELVLACHHRVLSSNPKVTIGLPEVLIGLFPGRRRHPAPAAPDRRADSIALYAPGQEFPPARGAGPEGGRRAGRAGQDGRGGQGLGQGEPRCPHPALGCEGLQGAGRIGGNSIPASSRPSPPPMS